MDAQRPPGPGLTPAQQAYKARWQSRTRSLADYHECLFRLPPVAPWQPASVFEAVMQQARRPRRQPLTVVDFGCGGAIALCGIAAWLQQQRLPARVVGLDMNKTDNDGNPFQLFPDTWEGRQGVLALYADELMINGPPPPVAAFPWPELHRCNVEVDPWPLAPDSVDLAVSMMTIPFLTDKLGFVERVYEVLAPGGIAVLHLDLFGQTQRTDRLGRLVLPGDVPFEELLAAQRRQGLAIAGTAVLPPRGLFYVLIMQKQAGTALDFGLQVIESGRESQLPDPPPDAWGIRTVYGRVGE